MGTQKNCLIFEHPKHMLKMMGKEILTFYAHFFLSKSVLCYMAHSYGMFPVISNVLVPTIEHV